MNVLSKVLKEFVVAKEQQQKNIKPDKWRLKLHLMPPTGFMNDPNGLCWFKGLWHVFFQYAPASPDGGLKFWGHYTSPDLLSWTYHGVPLLPDETFDCHGEYSGSAIVSDGKLHVFYSGNLFLNGNPTRAFSIVHVVSEDGFHFSEKQVVIGPQEYPKACSCQIRDPKVWKDGTVYHMVIGAQTTEETGALLLYRSLDLDYWEFDKMLQPSCSFGYMWECPDIFKINDKDYLSISPQGIETEEWRYANIFQSVWAPMSSSPDFQYTEWDMGFDFYAPQTFRAPDGRQILYAWMGMDALGGYTNPTINYGWQHAQTLPRTITENNGKLLQMPVKELEQLRQEQFIITSSKDTSLPCELEFENPLNSQFELDIGTGLHFSYDKRQEALRLWFSDATGSGRTERKAKSKDIRSIRAWIDTSSIEIFVNDGEKVFTTRFYPEGSTVNISYSSSEPCQLKGWKLNSIRIERGIMDV